MPITTPRYPGKSLPVAIPLPPDRRAPPIIRPIKPAQAVAQALPAVLPEIRTSANKITGRLCGCCGKEISWTATRCPYCQSWSKSAVEGRQRVECGILLLIICPIAIFCSCLYAWPKQKHTIEDASSLGAGRMWAGRPQTYPWHEKVSYSVQQRPTNNPVEVMVLNAMGPINHYRFEFSFMKFLTSVSGWIVISSCIIFVCSTSMVARGKRKVNRTGYC